MMRTHVIQYRLRTAGALAVAMLACAPRVASAQPADQFFKGKVINLYIGFAAGGSYDYYARLVARFIGKNIPGNPTVVAQTMAGAGSFQAANFLFAVAPRDGTAMGIITQTLAIEDALHSPAVHYKASEFTWIGRVTAILEVALTGQTAKAKTIDDARRYETPVAGTGLLPAPVLVAMVSVVFLVKAAGAPDLDWKLTWMENWSPALTRT